MRLFVPACGFRIILEKPWTFDVYYEGRNKQLLEANGVNLTNWWHECYEPTANPREWPRKMRRKAITLDNGTLLEVDRVYVRSNSKSATTKDADYDSLTFRIIDPKTGKGKIRFWAKLADVNNIDYELPPDFTAGKDSAYAKALAPKKMKPQDILNRVHHGIEAYQDRRKTEKAPAWMTVDLAQQFKAVSDEHNRLLDPYSKRIFEANAERQLAELKHQIATGHLHVPLHLADHIKTIDDYQRLFPDDRRFFPYEPNDRVRVWDYIVPHVLLSYYTSNSTFSRDADGNPVRTYRHRDDSRDRNYPKLGHIWVKVTTNKEDTEVIGVEAGFDPPKENT